MAALTSVQVGNNWKCPYCEHAQVVAEERLTKILQHLQLDGWVEGIPAFQLIGIACANPSCRKLSVEFAIVKAREAFGPYSHRGFGFSQFKRWSLLPQSNAKALPCYIPSVIRADYEEACAIRDLSPKASATLIRRCLQGMIRDFCGISQNRLIDEIKELRRLVDAGQAPQGVLVDHVEAIDHVRKIGTIGAHMERDIDLIVDVDPDEADTLIQLSEMLFDEWYKARESRKERLAKLAGIAADKEVQKKPKDGS